MTPLVRLAAHSAWNRRASLVLAVGAMALSVMLLLAVERLREEARNGFEQSVSGADLIVGARGSPLQLLLYSVFRLGDASQDMSWASVEKLSGHPAVAWVIPLSLGDSHRGYPVLATTQAYFAHFRTGEQRPLVFRQGRPFRVVFETVLGAEVADALRYRPGDRIALAHGSGESGLAEHTDKPFTVVGILARTGTPVDRTVHISLAAMEAIHLDWQGGAPVPGFAIPAEWVQKFDLRPKTVTAAIVGLKSRAAVFGVQHWVNQNRDEALMAVLPGVALAQLWEMLAQVERVLFVVSALVVAVGLAGLVAVVLASLDQRRRELAILRAVGARPRDILALLMLEGAGLVLAGALSGLALLTALVMLAGPLLEARYGLALAATLPGERELFLLGGAIIAGFAASLIPAWRAYRASLADGLTPKI
ncbi:MAG: ABC transporter permease [Thiobacillus sp.]|nr:ABC transporter permease [Thiobacillus sp.]